MRRPSLPLFFFWVASISMTLTTPIAAIPVAGAPISENDLALLRRQDPTGAPTTFKTVTQSTTSMGLITETCQVVLTPIKVNGQDAFEEVKSCTLTMDTSNNSGGSGTAGDSGTTTISDTSSTSSSADSSSTSTSAGSDTTSSATATDSSSSATSAASGSLETFPVTQVPAPSTTASSDGSSSSSAAASGSDSASTTASATGGASPIETFPVTSVAASVFSSMASAASASAAADNTASAAAESASTSATPAAAAAFEVPGKSISVLPIGLGVFAGISVIALIVVGLVMYERTKYRKAFRQRKLAEQGGGMGYGGMAQRV